MTPLLAFLLSVARADALAECHKTIDRVLGLPPPVARQGACNPMDPACAALKQGSANAAKMQPDSPKNPRRELPPACRPIVQHRCDAYASLIAQGSGVADAWSCSMSSCSKSPETAGYGLIACICRGEPDLAACGPAAPPVPPPPSGDAVSPRTKL